MLRKFIHIYRKKGKKNFCCSDATEFLDSFCYKPTIINWLCHQIIFNDFNRQSDGGFFNFVQSKELKTTLTKDLVFKPFSFSILWKVNQRCLL